MPEEGTVTMASTTSSEEELRQALGVKDEPKVEATANNDEPVAPESGAATGGEAPDVPEDQPYKPGKKGWQKRVDTLTRRNSELESLVRAQTEQLGTVLERLTGKVSPQAPAQPQGKPTADQFGTYEEYVEALADHKAAERFQREFQAIQQRSEQARQEESERQTASRYRAQVESTRAKHEDFDEVVGRDDILIPAAAQRPIMRRANGAEIAYYLGKHPEICNELIELEPDDVAARIGEISFMLGNGNVSASRASRAPAPVKTVTGNAAQSTQEPGEMSYQDYRRYRDAGGR